MPPTRRGSGTPPRQYGGRPGARTIKPTITWPPACPNLPRPRRPPYQIRSRQGAKITHNQTASDDDELERLALMNTPGFRRLLDAVEQRMDAMDGIKHDDFWNLVDEGEGSSRAGEG